MSDPYSAACWAGMLRMRRHGQRPHTRRESSSFNGFRNKTYRLALGLRPRAFLLIFLHVGPGCLL